MAQAPDTPSPAAQRPTLVPRREIVSDPGVAAFYLLRAGFVVAPILFGIDKFFDWMVDWKQYLWSGFADFFPGNAHQIMLGIGVVEIIAGLVVLFAPRVGGPLVAAWLGAIVTNLVIVGVADDEYWDIALRDFGLMIGAVALSLLAWKYARPRRPREAGRRFAPRVGS